MYCADITTDNKRGLFARAQLGVAENVMLNLIYCSELSDNAKLNECQLVAPLVVQKKGRVKVHRNGEEVDFR